MALTLIHPKWRTCGHGLNPAAHEGMKDISNVKVHLKFCSGHVKLFIKVLFVCFVALHPRQQLWSLRDGQFT